MNPSTTNSIEITAIAIIIVLLLLVIAWMGGRRLFEQQIVKGSLCPKCGGTSFHRIHRTLFDRIFGVSLAVGRYRCGKQDCKWTGLRHSHSHSHHHSQANENLSP
jgi:hypothetical protein